MWTVIFWFIVFSGGFTLGYIAHGWMNYKFQDYSGTIVVRKDDIREKTVYSLILDDYPEKLEFKRTVIFKVDNSEENPDRT